MVETSYEVSVTQHGPVSALLRYLKSRQDCEQRSEASQKRFSDDEMSQKHGGIANIAAKRFTSVSEKSRRSRSFENTLRRFGVSETSQKLRRGAAAREMSDDRGRRDVSQKFQRRFSVSRAKQLFSGKSRGVFASN